MNISNLSADDLSRFANVGYLVLCDDRIVEIKEDVCRRLGPVADSTVTAFPEGVYRQPDEPLHAYIDRLCAIEIENRITRAMFEVFASSVELFGLMAHKYFLDLCKQLGIATPMVWTTPAVRIDRPGEARFLATAHQDFGSSFLSPNGLSFWLPLAPLDSETGTILVVPGSHKNGYQPVNPNPGGYWQDVMRDEPPDDKFISISVGADEMLIFGPFLVHKSEANLSKDRVRLTLQLRFNDVDTLPEKTSAFVAKGSPYRERKYREHMNE